MSTDAPDPAAPARDAKPAGPGAERPYAELWDRPGYLVRRLHQIHGGLFAEEFAETRLTPVQFGLLSVLAAGGAFDQFSLSSAVGIDRTSGADVIKRLERRGLLERTRSERDRRANVIRITAEGAAVVERMRRPMERAQERLVAPLTADERTTFFRLVRKMIGANDSASRAPLG